MDTEQRMCSKYITGSNHWMYIYMLGTCRLCVCILVALNHWIHFTFYNMNKALWSKGLTLSLFLFCAHSVIEDFFLLHLVDLIGRLWHEWAAFSQPLIFFKVSSVPRHSCHICHLQPPTGKALFRTDIGTFWRSYQYCSESAARLHCNSICNFN